MDSQESNNPNSVNIKESIYSRIKNKFNDWFPKVYLTRSSKRVIVSSFSMLVLILGLITATFLVQQPQDIRKQAAELDDSTLPSCSQMILSPSQYSQSDEDKYIYQPGETISITVVGQGEISDITLWQMPATMDLTQNNPRIWREITTGDYNPATKTWTGTWTLPDKDYEYLVVPNLHQTDGLICTSNPGYTCDGCRSGTLAGGPSSIQPGVYPCSGCQKTITVNRYYRLTQGIDMKRYWNLNSGYSWVYQGVNKYSGEEMSFRTRIETEEKSLLCGHEVLPIRYTKDNPYGYWWPLGSGGVTGLHNLRWHFSYFQNGERWSENTLGALFTKSYVLPSQSSNPLSQLGPIYDLENGFFTRNHAFDAYFSDTYFAPYLLAESIVDYDWIIDRVDSIYLDDPNDYCNLYYDRKASYRYFSGHIFEETIDTPAYKGPGIRIRYEEGGLPLGTHWHVREDWYFAKDIGLVQLEEKDLRGKCYDPVTLEPLPNMDPDCDGMAKMQSPPVQMKLTNYYIGGPLVIVPDKSIVELDDSYSIRVTNQQGMPYTGYLQGRNCISETSCNFTNSFNWLWVENGVAVENIADYSNIQTGLYHGQARPLVAKYPADSNDPAPEVVLTSTELPWSNKFMIRIVDSNVPSPTPVTLDTPNLLSVASCRSSGRVRIVLRWSQIDGANNYRLMKCTGGNCDPAAGSLLYSGPNLAYTDLNCRSGVTCRYQVQAQNTTSGINSDWSNVVSKRVYCY